MIKSDSQSTLCDGQLKELTAIAIKWIKVRVPKDGYYLAFSGGKDSCVIYDLAKKAGVPIEPHFHFTTVNPPELVRFVFDNFPEIIVDRPKQSMFKLIEKKGFFPTRQIRYCCDLLKEYGGRGRTIITGVRWQESKKRSTRKIFEEDYNHKGTFYLNPIIDWKEETVWQYIRHNNLKYCSLYDEGFKRIGCIMCPLQGAEQMIKEAERWPKFKKAYLAAISRGLSLSQQRGKKSRVSGLTPEDTMRWWIYSEQMPCAEQCQLLG